MTIHNVMHRSRKRPIPPARRAPAGALTLRNLPPAVAAELRRLAAERDTSLNRVVVALLTERLGRASTSGRGSTDHRDLDALAGAWTRAQASAFDRALLAQRRIDPEVWERKR